MGFLKKLAKSALTAITEGAKNGAMLGLSTSLRTDNPYRQQFNEEIDSYTVYDDANYELNSSSFNINSYNNLVNKHTNAYSTRPDFQWTASNDGMMKISDSKNSSTTISQKSSSDYDSYNYNVVPTTHKLEGFKLNIPVWGYDSFIQERAVWQKGLQNPFGEPGYFYFKIFFDFDTQYGLFGGILNDEDVTNATNSAAKYLYMLNSTGIYSNKKIHDRLITLQKFVKTLSYINCSSPWFFNEVRGLDKAMSVSTKEFSKEHTIEIGCNVDSIDMRLSTLMDLYTYSCFDNINSCEIIPENLRKFNMMIMIYNAPIRHLHTPSSTANVKNLNYKSISLNNQADWPSFKLFSFYNCEFNTENIGSMTPSAVNNEKGFQLGKSSITINYDKCLVYNMNEFNQFMFGSDGIYYNDYVNMNDVTKEFTGSNPISSSKDKMNTRLSDNFTKEKNNPTAIDSFERYAHNNLTTITSYGFGNLYGERATKPNLMYFNQKVRWLMNRQSAISEYGINFLAKLLGSYVRSSAKLSEGNAFLSGYGENQVGKGKFWEGKMQSLFHKKTAKGYAVDVYNMQQGINRYRNYNFYDTIVASSR